MKLSVLVPTAGSQLLIQVDTVIHSLHDFLWRKSPPRLTDLFDLESNFKGSESKGKVSGLIGTKLGRVVDVDDDIITVGLSISD